ncbi:hypothetical protein C7H19_02030 [Aphanothece hegewaldii CCALA 016]|uniref:RDD domain-containing protein n=1 Tax=Aphanothece hegewaldii CCALA 016 TaxID=2107694 RepID=A0A2T1M285_9CHRO|nr:RDD family protein [Aphanothece hegewaldii]PSF38859.1 hypothetical protein C7H19_02030 [Aphanothece hegewaldii CCALA 016]
MNEDSQPLKLPKVSIDRRAYAFLIDFVTVWLVSSFAGTVWLLQFLVFIVAWFALRVVLVEKNKGQSLGRWALDMKVIDLRFKRIPGLVELAKREGIVGLCAALTMLGLNYTFPNPISMILLSSFLLADCGMALGDEQYNQAFHDRLSGTVIIPSKRGFSLDLRLKRLWREIKQKMRK